MSCLLISRAWRLFHYLRYIPQTFASQHDLPIESL
jgi:hypothetical protein